MISFLDIEQNTEEWYKAREDRVTGSNGDIMLSRGRTAAIKSNRERFKGNYYTARGHRLEPIAISVYEKIFDTKVNRVGFVVNDKYENAGCSPDGIDGDWLIEVKCFGSKRHLEIQKPKDIPFKIMAQLQFNMMICELKKSRLVMFNPDIEDNKLAFCVIEVAADDTIQANLARKLDEDELQSS